MAVWIGRDPWSNPGASCGLLLTGRGSGELSGISVGVSEIWTKREGKNS